MSTSYGKGGAAFRCVLMTRGDRKPLHERLETPQQRRERIQKLVDRRKGKPRA